MNECCFCGFESKQRGSVFVEMADGRLRCKSGTACMRRLRSGKQLKRPVRLALEIDSPLDDDTRQAIANVREADRIQREIRKALYTRNLCVDCGVRLHGPGWPRCRACNAKRPRF